jgi:hypothetical protein
LNDLLGGKETVDAETLANLPKTEAELPERAPENLHPDVFEATASVLTN